MILALHVPVKDTFGAIFETVLKPSGKIFQPFASLLFIEAEYQTIPIGDLDPLLALFNATLLLFARNPGVGIIESLVVFVIIIVDSWAEEMALCRDLLEFFVPLPQYLVDICHYIGLPS